MIWKSSTSYREREGRDGGTSQPLHTCRERLMLAAWVIRRELDEREREREGGVGVEGEVWGWGSRYCGNFVMKWLLFHQKRFHVSLRYRRGTPLPRARLSDYYVDSVWDPGSARRLLFDNYTLILSA